jgi:outer membrane protein TolC
MIRLLVLAIVLPLGAAPVRAVEAPLTLEAAIQLALTHNERAGKAAQRVEVAIGGVDRARTAFLPTLGGVLSGDASNQLDRNGNHYTATVSAAINQPLLVPSSIPLWAQAKHNLASERWGAVEDLRVLAFDTTSAFVTALSTDQLLAAAQGRLARAQADAADTAARAKAGLTSSNDVTRGDLAVASAQSQVASAQGNRDRAYLQLGYLIGASFGPLVEPERTTDSARQRSWNPEEVERRAEARRPDLRSAEEHTESLRRFAREPLARLAPTLGLSGLWRRTLETAAIPALATPPPDANNLSASLTLTWTLYDAGVRYADRRVRLAQLDSAALDEAALRRSVKNDIAIALAQLRAARQVYRSSQQAVVTAQKNTEETEILYKQGLAKAIELIDANATRYDADSSLALAKLAMEQAYLNLRFALGLGPVSDDLPKVSAPRVETSR